MRIASRAWPPNDDGARAVALQVLLNGPISRSEIARRLDLSQGSLTRLSTPLVESGLLFETGEQPSDRAGRRSRPLDIVTNAHHFVGVKLTGEKAIGVVTDLRANVVHHDSVDLDSTEPAHVADQVAALTIDLAEQVPTITALGIGLGGLVTDYTTITSAPYLDWSDVPLGPMLTDRTGLPTVIENDLTAYTESQHWFGAGRGVDRFAVLTVGAGIGYGLVVHDRIVVGEDSGVGLVGHWALDPFGPHCPEGHRGCADSVLTMSAITNAVSSAIDRDIGYDECLDLAEEGNPAAGKIVYDACIGLGRLMAAVANLTVPQKIVLGGEGIRLVHTAPEAIDIGFKGDRDSRAGTVKVEVNDGDVTEWCRGAAVIAIQTYVLGIHPTP